MSKPQFLICVNNDGYPVSLGLRKIYRRIPDAEEHQLVRIIDKSGEDYLYPMDNFIPFDLP